MPSTPFTAGKRIILLFILLLVIFLAYAAWQAGEVARQSERHAYSYTIELSYNTTIENVTLILPVPELNSTPYFTESLLNGTAYGVPPGWDFSQVRENGSPMLAIRSDRMVPDYHGTPIAIVPGQSPLPATLVPGHEYTSDTPVLIPVTIAVTETGTAPVYTRMPVGHEPVFFPSGTFSPGSGATPLAGGTVYTHRVPLFINYSSQHPADVGIRVSVTGSNEIWKGGWESNTYADSVFVENHAGTTGWIGGDGKLITGEGVYY